ncbi:TBPIP-domain-containing protein [Gloeopeniophorella convolvens]|nr:TBPIP-domain-containing protein [Gloeopeniophorella convolvens]
MSSKAKSDVKVLKGQEAEDKVYDYIKRMNRPYGAVDVSANLKGAVPKATTQKILLALAEKGAITQKIYGKTTFFVAKQNNLDTLPDDKIKALTAEVEALNETNKTIAAEVKTASAELAKIKNAPTDAELTLQIEEAESKCAKLREHLEPLRSGTPLVSAAELDFLDAEWVQWRAEWLRRRKVYLNFWALVSDALPPPDATQLTEDLGLEQDTPEHLELERGPLCTPAHASRRR